MELLTPNGRSIKSARSSRSMNRAGKRSGGRAVATARPAGTPGPGGLGGFAPDAKLSANSTGRSPSHPSGLSRPTSPIALPSGTPGAGTAGSHTPSRRSSAGKSPASGVSPSDNGVVNSGATRSGGGGGSGGGASAVKAVHSAFRARRMLSPSPVPGKRFSFVTKNDTESTTPPMTRATSPSGIVSSLSLAGTGAGEGSSSVASRSPSTTAPSGSPAAMVSSSGAPSPAALLVVGSKVAAAGARARGKRRVRYAAWSVVACYDLSLTPQPCRCSPTGIGFKQATAPMG